MASNPVHHRRTKHIEIDIHFVREKVALGEVRVLHVPTSAQFTHIFTEGISTAPFIDIRSSLNIVTADVDTTGGVNDMSPLRTPICIVIGYLTQLYVGWLILHV